MKVLLLGMVGFCLLCGVACAIFIFLRLRRQEPAAQDSALVMAIGDSKEITAPQGSASAGSTWIQFAVTYRNRSKKSVWINGYSPDNVFYKLETRADEQGQWTAYARGYCGTGATRHEIHSGEWHNFAIELPEGYRGNEFRVILDYHADASEQAFTRAESPQQKVMVRKITSRVGLC